MPPVSRRSLEGCPVPQFVTVPASYETATHADGPAVYEWLSENGHLENLVSRGPTVDRRVRMWRSGECPSFDTLDRVLLRAFDVYVRDLPDGVWIHRQAVRVGKRKVAA